VTGDWRKKHNEKLHNLFYSPYYYYYHMIKSRRMRWAGYAARIGEMTSAYRDLVAKPEWKRPLGKHRHRWEDNIKIMWESVDWIHLARDSDH
jgi:hypothetical protein